MRYQWQSLAQRDPFHIKSTHTHLKRHIGKGYGAVPVQWKPVSDQQILLLLTSLRLFQIKLTGTKTENTQTHTPTETTTHTIHSETQKISA